MARTKSTAVKQTVAKRHRKVLRDNIHGITKPAIQRLMRRGGVKRASSLIYDESRDIMKIWLEQVLKSAITIVEYERKKTVTSKDVKAALKQHGHLNVC